MAFLAQIRRFWLIGVFSSFSALFGRSLKFMLFYEYIKYKRAVFGLN